MKFTEYEVMKFEEYAKMGKQVCVKCVNYAGQEFVMSGIVVADNRKYYGDLSALTDFRLTLDIGQREWLSQPMNMPLILRGEDEGARTLVPIYTEPKDGEKRTIFVCEIMTDQGIFVWKNLKEAGLVKNLKANRVVYQGECDERRMSAGANKLMKFIGKPCVVYGENIVVTAVREFDTDRGLRTYIDCISSNGEKTICVTPDAVRLDKKAEKRVKPVEGCEEFF